MAGYLLRSDRLWQYAAQLLQEEEKSIPFVQQGGPFIVAEHSERIQTKYNQLVINLSCLGDIIAAMYQKKKLTQKELEQIQDLQSTPIRANEELLSIIARKPKDVYECLLSLIKRTNQPHLYQMLVSADNSYDEAATEHISRHKDLIRRNYMWLSDKLDTENGLISLLYQQNVLTAREREEFFGTKNAIQKNELLLGMISKKSPEDFTKCLEALEASGQGHLTTELRNREECICINANDGEVLHSSTKCIPDDPATVPSLASTPEKVDHELRPKEVNKYRQKAVQVRSFSKPDIPPKPPTKPVRKLNPSNSLPKPALSPKPVTQSTSAQHYGKSMHTASKDTEERINFWRAEEVQFQAKLKGLESRLQSDIAVKVTDVSLSCLEKPDDDFRMFSRIILQECHQMRKEIVARNVQTNVELEQLQKSGSQNLTAAKLSEAIRVQQKMINEILRLEEKIDNLKTDIHKEKAKTKGFEEDKLQENSIIIEVEDKLKKTESDKQLFKEQIHKSTAHIASIEDELQRSKADFDEINAEVILLRIEMKKLKEACDILRKENEAIKNTPIIADQLLDKQRNNRDLFPLQTEKGGLLEKERSLVLSEEEQLELRKLQEGAVEGKSSEDDRKLNLSEELESEKQQRHELEKILRNVTAQLGAPNCRLQDRSIPLIITQESLVIRHNHQFLVENIKSNRLIIRLLHKNKYITDEEQRHLNDQPFGFYRNDALLQWMRTIPFKEDKGLMVLECFRQAQENFVVDLLEKGGVLIKSKISTNIATEGLLAKFRSTNVQELKGKEAMVINKLNQQQGLSLSSRRSSISENPDDDIVIAPYCHQEANGITMWFWCRSINGARNLKQIYKSDILLDILVTIFKEFSNDSVISASTVLVPTSIAVFMCDFTEDGKKYETDPVLIAKTNTKAADHGKKSINGLAILDTKLFVVIEDSSVVEVYDSIKLSFSRQWKLKGLGNPLDIGSCNINKCLYIIDFKAAYHMKEILRVDKNGKLINKWSTGYDYGFNLSVTYESNVIVALYLNNKIYEYSPDGNLIRTIGLSQADIRSPLHVTKLPDGNFVVSHGTSDGDLHRICKVDANGKLVKSIRGKLGLNSAQLKRPVYLAVDGDGFVIVIEQLSGQVSLLDSDLNFIGEILKKEKTELRSPAALFLDESNGRMLVADNHDGRILNFQLGF